MLELSYFYIFWELSAYLLNEIFGAAILNNQLEISSEKISYVISSGDIFIYLQSPYYDFSTLLYNINMVCGILSLLFHFLKGGSLKFWILVGLPLIYYLLNWDDMHSTYYLLCGQIKS